MASTQKYHHGDLRPALLREADCLLREQGIEGLSLRQVAERAGVSRTAPYHHFRDKQALLCALAAEGFRELEQLMEQVPLNPEADLETSLDEFVQGYLRFATAHPERYDLMFGRPIWKTGSASPELKEIAYRAFRRYTEKIGSMLPAGPLAGGQRPLRIAQASWATLHGLCRLVIDGIYVNATDMEAVSEEAVRLMLVALRAR